jgi:SAM-dependent methyltransferase
MENPPTRGKGLLEGFLARKRATLANRLIPKDLRSGRILDIGCGSYPYFLAHTAFQEKHAIDVQDLPNIPREIDWHSLDLNEEPRLAFNDSYFSVVTLLAVIEHLDPSKLVHLFNECNRVLEPGGMLLLTTPAAWSNGILEVMARLGLVSAEEIREHVYTYSLPLLGWYFGAAGFAMDRVGFGYFELRLNLWATARA